jgi:PrtD family type I secretion system ABC transporter
MKRLLNQAIPTLVMVLIFSLAVNVLRFVTPIYMLQVLDRVIASRSLETLAMLTLLALVATGVGLVIDSVRRRMLTRVGDWLESELAPDIVRTGLLQNGATTSRTSDLLRHLACIRTFTARALVNFVDLLFAPVFLVVIYLIHPLLGLVAFAAAAVVVAATLVRRTIIHESRSSSQSASRAANQLLDLAERNSEVVSGLAMAPAVAEKWNAVALERATERRRADDANISYAVAVRGVARALRILMIAVGVWLFLRNEVTLGAVFGARLLAAVGFRIVQRAMRYWQSLAEALAAFENLDRSWLPPATGATSVPVELVSAPLILDSVTFRHPGQPKATFRNVAMTLAAGELMVVTGGADTGKTTLSRLIVGLLKPRQGQIRLGDIAVDRLPLNLRTEIIGYVPQKSELIEGSVKDNIARFSDRPLEEVVRAAQLAGIHDVIVRLPAGYDTDVSEGSIVLSGSRRQKIAIARAFIGNPRLIVLDEPMTHLDAVSRRHIEASLLELKKTGSTIIVTQSIESTRLARIADRNWHLGTRVADATNGAAQSTTRTPAKLRRVL